MGDEVDGKVVPLVYRDVYARINPNNSGRVTTQLFSNCMQSTGISGDTLKSIFSLCDEEKTDVLSKSQFYRALALVAIAQHGEAVDKTSISRWAELPALRINVAALATISSPESTISFTYRELEESEYIQLTVDKKGGLIMKHTNYKIYSRRKNCTFVRRYSDFEAFDSVLRKRFPYRLIPTLPKKAISNKKPEFIETRRKHLQRYLTFVGRHPILRDDDIVKFFFTETGSDFQSRLKSNFKSGPTEYEFNPMAGSVKDMLPADIVGQVNHILVEIDPLLKCFQDLVSVADELRAQSLAAQTSFVAFGDKLRELSGISSGYLAGQDNWTKMQTSFKDIASHLTTVSDRCNEQSIRESDGICDNLRRFCELLTGLKELLVRRQKGIANDIGKTTRQMSKDRQRLESMSRKSSSSDVTKAAALEGSLQSVRDLIHMWWL